MNPSPSCLRQEIDLITDLMLTILLMETKCLFLSDREGILTVKIELKNTPDFKNTTFKVNYYYQVHIL